MANASEATRPGRHGHRPWAYVQIARIDHWGKNAFMLLGVFFAFFFEPSLLAWSRLPVVGLALLATCITASSNYVINETLDARFDREHPTKRYRPAAAREIRPSLAVAEWLALGALGIALGAGVNLPFAAAAACLWIMGVVYNVRPLRSKEVPYLDVVSESVNNPIRLVLGWFVLIPDRFPPVSLILAYWMMGAFFMAMKRFAEYREIGDPAVARRYRRSFGHYDESRLLVSLFFYATACALFVGVFIVRYRLELILMVPLLAGFFAFYMKLGFAPNSPVQSPERLYREPGFLAFSAVTAGVGALLMLTDIPALYDLFNVEPLGTLPLWIFGGS